ncbi:SH3 domain-containing protein [Natronospira bacteriovora]|uniref:SH3 domain-containing protein n=1 Tax=Natronospira bacteriovora TaxID=3069753 RepID=A0ABU0W6Q0_9GAMM|nr:SH3 domain-containing protein [Natronospira sp. AB-CW4]MDQ2069710.1 SH3 domain-containing protein [Natronospira sp. AB-CW4]
MKRIRLLILGLLLSPALLLAEPAWVIDRLYLSLYPEPDSSTQRITLLESGDELERLGEVQNGFAQVETANGTVGWVNQDFLVNSLPARVRIDDVERERDSLRNQLANREGAISTLEARVAELEAELGQAVDALATSPVLDEEIETAVEPDAADAETDPVLEEAATAESAPVEAATPPGDVGLVMGWREGLLAGGLLLIALFLSGLFGFILRERQIRNRLGGLSL